MYIEREVLEFISNLNLEILRPLMAYFTLKYIIIYCIESLPFYFMWYNSEESIMLDIISVTIFYYMLYSNMFFFTARNNDTNHGITITALSRSYIINSI